MRGFFYYDNKFFRLMAYLFDLVVLNLLWMLFSLPMITAGISTCALFRVILDQQSGQEGYLARGFLRAFCSYWKQGLIVGNAALLGGFVVLKSLLFWNGQEGMLANVCRVLGTAAAFYLVMMLLYLYPVLVSAEKGILECMKRAFCLSVQNFPRTLMMLGLVISTGILSLTYDPAAMVFLCLGVSGICYMICFLMKGKFRNHSLP